MRNITRTLLASCIATATLMLSAGAIADRGSWNPPGQGWNHHHKQAYKYHDRRWDNDRRHDRRVIRERVYIHGAPAYYDSRVYYGPARYGPPPYYPRYQHGASVIIHLPPIILR